MALENFFNFIFGPIINLGSPWNIIFISFILTLIVNLAMKFFTNQKIMKSLKDDTEYFKKEMQKFKNDPQKLLEIQKRSMETSLKYMKHSLPATLVTLLPLLFIFGWLRQTFPPGQTLLNLPFGISLGWLGSYILFSIVFNIVLRKLLKIH